MNITDFKRSRKSAIKSLFATLVPTGDSMLGFANTRSAGSPEMEIMESGPGYDASIRKLSDRTSGSDGRQPLFSGATVHDGFVFVAGKGEHGEGDIKVHTDSVLRQIEEELERAGSSMENALHVNVYLHNLRDYDGMNEVYRGRFGNNPPARTTVACYSGIPGNSLVEMDCIAAV